MKLLVVEDDARRSAAPAGPPAPRDTVLYRRVLREEGHYRRPCREGAKG